MERTGSMWLVSRSPGTVDLLSSIGGAMLMSRYSDTVLLRLTSTKNCRAGVMHRHNRLRKYVD